MTTARPCLFCTDQHMIDASACLATVSHEGVEVQVTLVKRICDRTGQSFENTHDHDYRSEARAKLNLAHGNPPDTRLPGLEITRMGKFGSVPVPTS